MTVKEYLSRYHKTKVKIELLKQQVEEYIRLANSIPGINFDTIRVDGTKSLKAPFEKWIHKTLDNELLINELERNLPIIKGEIITLIESLENKQYGMVLLHRYIDWMTWSEISKKMYCSISTIKRWHKNALSTIHFE